MRRLLWLALAAAVLPGCDSPSRHDQYAFVGELSTLHTMKDGSRFVLNAGEGAYELAFDEDTRYVDIMMTAFGANWMLGGEYGINGALSGSRIAVDEIAYLGGGQPIGMPVAPGPAPAAVPEPPLFVVDGNATGPLTMEELNIRIPSDLAARLSEQKQACWLRNIERMIAEAGDPATLDPHSVEYLQNVELESWMTMSPKVKRALVAQAITSKAIMLC